jgi:hypothetical protein
MNAPLALHEAVMRELLRQPATHPEPGEKKHVAQARARVADAIYEDVRTRPGL